MNDRWLDALGELEGRYPHRLERPREDNFGIALLSRFPFDQMETRPLGYDVEAILARFTLGSLPTAVVLAHPVPPVGGFAARLRNRQLAALAALRAEDPASEFILLGDLNTSPWSAPYRRLEAAAGLRNAARGLGWFPSWPAWAPWLRIPIDHCLLSPGLRATDFRLGPDTGSDHFPVLVHVAARS